MANLSWSALVGLTGDIAVNILSDLLFIALIAVGGVFLYKRSRGSKLQKFFGLRSAEILSVCLSDPRWHPQSSTPDGICRADAGMGLVIPFMEYNAVQKIADNFRFLVPGTGDLPDAFKQLFFAEHGVRIIPATADSSWQQSPCFIAIGSGAFNPAAEEFEQRTNRTLSFQITTNGGTKTLIGLKTPWGQFNRHEHQNGMLAVLAKAQIENTTAFYCAGFDEIGSSGSAYFLAKNWQDLAEQFGSSNFIVLLDFWNVRDIQAHAVIRHKCEWRWE